MSDNQPVTINVTNTPFQVEQGEIQHAKTEYLISRYPTGISNKYKIIVDSPITSYSLTDLELDKENDWYIFTRYDGDDGKTKSPWSYPVKYQIDTEPPIIYRPEIISPKKRDKINMFSKLHIICSPFRASKYCNHSSTRCLISAENGYFKKYIWLPPVNEFTIDPYYGFYHSYYYNIDISIKYYANNNTVESEESKVIWIDITE